MSSYTATALDLYEKLTDLVVDQAAWSQATFGTDLERGPVGPLRHLASETAEAAHEWERWVRDSAHNPGVAPIPKGAFFMELADCLLLLLDASRRGGIKFVKLVEAAQEKMELNKKRRWPVSQPDAPVEHIPDAVP